MSTATHVGTPLGSAEVTDRPALPGGAFQRLVGVTAIASVPLAFGCLLLSLMAVDFDPVALENPATAITLGRRAADLLFWSMMLDAFGYYLLLAPAAVLLWLNFKTRDEGSVALYTFCGLSYILLGATGAVALAAVGRPMIGAYVDASAAQREMLEVSFQMLTYLVHGGLWNILQAMLAGVWWLGIGVLLRSQVRWLGDTTIVLGLSALLDAAGNILHVPILAALGLNFYLVVAPLWALLLGTVVLRGSLRPRGYAR